MCKYPMTGQHVFGPWENCEQKILGRGKAIVIMPLYWTLVEMVSKGHQPHFRDDDGKNNNPQLTFHQHLVCASIVDYVI